MNTASDYPLIDRYLDGLTTQDEAAAVVEAVESDPDALAWLRQAAEMEAGIQFHLAGSSQHRPAPLRIIPFWHWHRAGKWCATAAAVAALVVCAAVFLWPQNSTGLGGHQLSSGMTVQRFAPGKRSGTPLQAPELPAHGAIEEVEFRPGPKWLQLLRTTRISEHTDKFSGISRAEALLRSNRNSGPGPEPKALPITDDQYLERYLRAAGVTFPEGAGASWVQHEPAFVVINTPENIAWITAMGEDPESRGPRHVLLEASVFFSKAGDTSFRSGAVVIPESLATERILRGDEVSRIFPDGSHRFTSQSDGVKRMVFGSSFGSIVAPSGVDVHMAFSRIANFISIVGLGGKEQEWARKGMKLEEYADTEFSILLGDGEAAVVDLGSCSDGSRWIMALKARLVPLPVEITLGSVPNVMQSDPKLLEVRAGAQVRLTHKNTACVLQHNFVLVKPGRASAVGALADQLIIAPDALAKLHIPESLDIIVTGKKLLAVGQSEIIEFTAPSEPGDYPWLCTFPGHWRLQQGILRVVP